MLPEVLKVVEVADPVPIPTEVQGLVQGFDRLPTPMLRSCIQSQPHCTELVRVRAAGINPVEDFIRAGRFPLLGQPPFILGWDISGVVESVHPGVNRFAVGDEVYGMPLFPRAGNAYAELVAAPSRQLARKPAGLTHKEAGALPLAGITAWQSLVDVTQVKPRILVHGADGGVGHLAVQIAKVLGAYAIGTASAGKHEFVRSLGADEVIDYRTTDFADQARDIDVVFETVGGDYAVRSLRTLRPGGLLVTIVDRLNAALAEKTRAAEMRFAGISVEPDYPGLEALARLVDAGQLRIHVARAFALAEAGEAHRFLSTSPAGKVVLVP